MPQHRANEDFLNREEDIRRLKAKNYGKWYLQPDDFNKKVDKFNRKLNMYFKNGSSGNMPANDGKDDQGLQSAR